MLTLPELARLYEVTVDDFYKKSTVTYDNYAQRLASVYEKSRDPEDFIRCRIEYEKLMKNGELSTEDKWLYAWIHMYMMNYCRDIAVAWYDKAVSDDPNDDPENYQIACMQRIWMFFLLHKEDEIISELEGKIKADPNNPRETDNLLVALIWTEKYDEALEYYDKAGEIGTYFCDEMDCKVGLYEEMREYEKAYNECMKMADIYRRRGYDVEADMAEKRAKEIKNKIKE